MTYLATSDVNTTVGKIKFREPIDHPYGRMGTVADDQCALFTLLGVTPA
jgi:hypothetical protein